MRKYRLFGKIPVFDLIIIAALILLALVGYKVFTSSKSGNAVLNSQTKTVRYTVDFLNLSNDVQGRGEGGVPEVGEKVYDTDTNTEIGRIVASSSRPFTNYGFDTADGKTVATEYTNRQTVTIVIEAKAVVSDKATEIGNVFIGLGKTKTLTMPSLCATGVIVDMEEVD